MIWWMYGKGDEKIPATKVILDYQGCDPRICERGICAAALVCERKVLQQERPYELPDILPSLCLGCKDCLSECPKGALRIMQ